MKKSAMNLRFFFLAVFLWGVMSCDKHPNEVNPTTGNGTAPAVIVGNRVNTPGGTVYYMGAYPDVPNEVNYESMVELGSSVTISSFGEHPYVWNGNASTLTKYKVADDLTISITDFVSFASTGLGGFFGPPAFLSETQAYFFALGEGKVIEFNPTSMEITEIIDVDPLVEAGDPDINAITYYSFRTEEGEFLLPVGSIPVDFNKFPQYALVAVFDPATKSVSYQKDTRMSLGYNNFAKDESSGNLYYRPARNTAQAEDYAKIEGAYPTTGGLLKMRNDGTYDPDFFIDLKELVNAHAITSVIYVYGTKAVVQHIDSSWEAPADPGEWFKYPRKLALVDLETLDIEYGFAALDQYGTVYSVGEVDGNEFYANF